MYARSIDLKANAESAAARIRPYVAQTPLTHSPALSDLAGATVYCKLENLQPTGSFKVRGAFNKLLSLTADQHLRGVVAASTGNHGAAVAFALATLKIPGLIFVPEIADPSKLAIIRRYGAEVRFHGTEGGATETHARQYAVEHQMEYVSPYNDWAVVAGQASIGLEIAQQLERVDTVIASLGGGGLLGGIGGYLKADHPGVDIVAASPRNSKTMIDSVRAGRIVETRHLPTLSDATAGGVESGAITFDLCRRFIDDYVDIDEDEIKSAMRFFIDAEHLLIEGSAGVAVAALIKSNERFAGKNVVVVICGANIGVDRLKDVL